MADRTAPSLSPKTDKKVIDRTASAAEDCARASAESWAQRSPAKARKPGLWRRLFGSKKA